MEKLLQDTHTRARGRARTHTQQTNKRIFDRNSVPRMIIARRVCLYVAWNTFDATSVFLFVPLVIFLSEFMKIVTVGRITVCAVIARGNGSRMSFFFFSFSFTINVYDLAEERMRRTKKIYVYMYIYHIRMYICLSFCFTRGTSNRENFGLAIDTYDRVGP